MKKYRALAAALAACMGLASQASAALVDRGNGMVYDDDLDITWLQDANYAATQYARSDGTLGDADGWMDWSAAVAWAGSLSYGGYDDWRLPATTDVGAPGCNDIFDPEGTDCGYNVDPATSELAHLFFVELRNQSWVKPDGSSNAANCSNNSSPYCFVNAGPFANLQFDAYWSGTEYAPDTGLAWIFQADHGQQLGDYKYYEFPAWAVRSGDVAATVPEPPGLALLAAGALSWRSKRRRACA